MFTDAIITASKFTRPIHTLTRLYGTTEAVPGAATLFFVNEEGWALTCKHVVQLIPAADRMGQTYERFKAELESIKGSSDFAAGKSGLERKYGYTGNTTIQMKNNFVGCVDRLAGFNMHLHPEYDLALLKFEGFSRLLCSEFPAFQKDESYLKQGRFLCRLGYPFPEFTNFAYNPATDDIEWTREGMAGSPVFPIEGMITRFLGDGTRTMGIEMSTPGLRGQSGGPLFNEAGVVQGMQFATKHLHLGFDIENKEIRVQGQKKEVSDYPFIHLGHCMHVSVLKEFMREKGIRFDER